MQTVPGSADQGGLSNGCRCIVQIMRIAVAGATGLIGRHLCRSLADAGHDVTRLVRGAPALPEDVPWNPAGEFVDTQRLEGLDVVVCVTGRSIDTRWTKARRAELRRSRVDVTRFLAETLARLESPPSVLVAASATGFYGYDRDEELTEASGPGTGFLAELCRDWEAAAEPARAAGIRVAHMRTAPVLTREGSPLSRLLLPFRLGLGATIGPGDNAFSWIAIDDLVGAVQHVIADERLAGPVNMAAPGVVSFREFTDTLAHVLHRPRLLRVPRVAVTTVLGEMAREVALASQNVKPVRLLETGFRFTYPTLEEALRHELGRSE
jgi:uncharacterized protein